MESVLEADIPRKLEDGWDFRPDWRHKVAESYLENRNGLDPREALAGEEDAFVRQYYLLRRTGTCMERAAFLWAYRCHANDANTGAATLIKALTIAQAPLKDIAQKLHTGIKNIAVFTKLFFDARAYLKERVWIASIVFPPIVGTPTLAQFREQHWLMAAFIGGRDGLERAVSRKMSVNNIERDQLAGEIRSALTVRAHSYLSSLQCGLTPPGPEDFERLVRLLDSTSRQPVVDNSQELAQIFIRGLHGDLKERAARGENPGDPLMDYYRELPKVVAVTGTDAGKDP